MRVCVRLRTYIWTLQFSCHSLCQQVRKRYVCSHILLSKQTSQPGVSASLFLSFLLSVDTTPREPS